MSKDTTYNGWSNYVTWRINLEMFDSYEPEGFDNPYDLSLHLKDTAEMYIEQSAPEGLAQDYAMAFISDVNWYEIALNMLSDVEEEENLDINLDNGLSAVNEQGETAEEETEE